VPTYGTDYSAGADLYAIVDGGTVEIAPHSTVVLGTGIAVEIPEGYCGLIFARSSLGTKRGLAPANKVGVIDSDYRGEFIVALHNHGKNPQTISHGERVAQLVITPVLNVAFLEAEELSDTQRAAGGFGSTGK
jgi:dUTP pyrophosphatase